MGSICTNSIQSNWADNSPRSGVSVAPIDMSSFKVYQTCIPKNREPFEDVYETEQRKLGFGYYGDVKKCVHRETGVVRAVKIVNRERIGCFSLDGNWFFRQIEILSQIDHPSFIRVHEYFEERDYFYLIMDYHKEGTLAAKLKASKGCSEDFLKKVMKKILSGVSHLHQKGLVHRDLKPENILISEKDEEILVKIIDFDTCGKLNEFGKLSGLYGTALYMPPEMALGEYDSKCDMWSAGMIMYNLMTGKTPFAGMSDHQIVENIQKLQIDFGCYEMHRYSDQCRELLGKLLQKDSKKRISAQNALAHPWFQASVNFSKIETVLNNIQQSKVKNLAIKEFLIKHFSLIKDFEELDLVFSELDTDNDGVISLPDFLNFFSKAYDKEESYQKTEKLFEKLKGLSEEFISYEDFLNACIKLKDILDDERILKFLDKGTQGLTRFSVAGLGADESWDWFLDLKLKIQHDITPKEFRGIMFDKIFVNF